MMGKNILGAVKQLRWGTAGGTAAAGHTPGQADEAFHGHTIWHLRHSSQKAWLQRAGLCYSTDKLMPAMVATGFFIMLGKFSYGLSAVLHRAAPVATAVPLASVVAQE